MKEETPYQSTRYTTRNKRGQFRAYAKCERCEVKPSNGLTRIAKHPDGSHWFEGYTCNGCARKLKTEVLAAGGTFEE